MIIVNKIISAFLNLKAITNHNIRLFFKTKFYTDLNFLEILISSVLLHNFCKFDVNCFIIQTMIRIKILFYNKLFCLHLKNFCFYI